MLFRSSVLTVETSAPNTPSITSVTDNTAPVTGALTSGAYTNDTSPVIKVSLTGTKAIAGDTVQLYNGTGTTSQLGSSYTLTSTDITNGYATVQPGTLLNGSTYNITSRITSTVDGLQSNASSAFTVTIDTAAPTAAATVTEIGRAHV